MKLPTPAELATFAQAIGWTTNLGRSFELDDKRLLLHYWYQWENEIRSIHKENERMNEPDRKYTITEVMAKLGSNNVEKLKEWFVAGFSTIIDPSNVGPEEVENEWRRSREENAFTDGHIMLMERERSRRFSERASKGGRGKAVKKTKQKR